MNNQPISNKADINLQSQLKVNPGQIFTVSLLNGFGKKFTTVDEFTNFLDPKNIKEKKQLNHPCAGPIEINAKIHNNSLAIHIVDLKATKGYQCISRSTGILKNQFCDRECAIYELEKDGSLSFRGNDVIMRGTPKLGFVTTLDSEERSLGRACQNGGNLDINLLDKGSTIYLPVNADTAKILVGDLHICQGNGEACGIAIEADGEATLKVDLVDKIDFPVIDHKDYLVIVGWGNNMEDSVACSVENAICYLQRVFPFNDWSRGEIYKFVSAEGNITMGNATGKVVTSGVHFYKRRIKNQYGFPIF
ncbi:MAG: hypothetical protein COC15_04345 [Legionellales bacterium]|nr:MAG: hypothetical protein COC15_04345 [Legionellales bacterium]